ncbi:hypothetical protein [Halomonas organivorans]|uniref:hypothetical protein n=1 Tax=Halomonas organivorans TaxID=257772 RepID=UPI00362E6FC5
MHRQLRYIDHACAELLDDWQRTVRQQGGDLEMIGNVAMSHRVEGRLRRRTAPA